MQKYLIGILLKILVRILLTFSSTVWMLVVYACKSNYTIGSFHILISSAIYISCSVILSYIVFPFAWTIVQLTRFVNLFIPSDKIAFIYGWNVTYNNYSIKDVFPVTYVPFEDMQAPVPHNYDAVLTRLFGDYMQIPPEEKRKVHSTKIEFYDE